MRYLISLMMICTTLNAATFGLAQSDSELFQEVDHLEEILNHAEARATPEAKAILQKSRTMINEGDIVLGSCWDYIDEVYNRAGYPAKKQTSIYQSKFKGPYLEDQTLIEPGDWLYYVNHSYGEGEHSGIFVEWTDYNLREALIISYAGGRRNTPARYKTYILDNVYNIIRAK